MDDRELAFAGLARQAELVRSKELTSRELIEAHLRRIEEIDPRTRAYRVVLAERALADADVAQKRLRAGDELPLLGVPVAIKDEFDVAGTVTARGSGAFDRVEPRDEEVVARLRAAGAIVIGKTNVPELSQWPFTESAAWGVTRNPWDRDRTPGGSSGGSGAAVAAGLAPGALGTDGGGSIRVPAACCGIFGIKPQRGRLPVAPGEEHWLGMTVGGPLARSVADAALLLDVISGPVPGQAVSPPAPVQPFAAAAAAPPRELRIAVSTQPMMPLVPVQAARRRAAEDAAQLLLELGYAVAERDPPQRALVPSFLARYYRGIHDDVAAVGRRDRLERRSRAMGALGALVRPGMIERLRAAEAGPLRRMSDFFEHFDVLVTPALAAAPLPIGSCEGRGAVWTSNACSRFTPFTFPWNVTGQPAASVPFGFDADGLPLGVQLVGRAGDEATLLALAAQIESARPWAQHRPPVS